MIEFNGEQSEQCKLIIAKEKAKNAGLLFTICSIIISIITIIVGIINSKLIYSLIIILIFVFLTISAFIVPKKQISSIKINSKVNINSDLITMKYSTNFYLNEKTYCKKISNIKYIIDFGICYCMIFKFGDISNSWVCEKSLITKGSISQFENLFKDKIKKKPRQ